MPVKIYIEQRKQTPDYTLRIEEYTLSTHWVYKQKRTNSGLWEYKQDTWFSLRAYERRTHLCLRAYKQKKMSLALVAYTEEDILLSLLAYKQETSLFLG